MWRCCFGPIVVLSVVVIVRPIVMSLIFLPKAKQAVDDVYGLLTLLMDEGLERAEQTLALRMEALEDDYPIRGT